jgi:ABC-type sugar transport system ATPase subunit
MTWTGTRRAPVELSGVSRRHGTVRVLESVSPEVHVGEIICVPGDNGAASRP